MRIPPIPLFLVVAVLAGASQIEVCRGADGDGRRPKTVSQLIREMGKGPGQANQLKLRLRAEITGKDLGKLPASMDISITHDKAENLVRVVNDSLFPDGTKIRTTTFSNKQRALKWAERKKKDEAIVLNPELKVLRLEPAATLPNPWVLPAKLAFPGLFTDALHGYEAFAREYSRSVRLNREADEAGLIWFDLLPSASSGAAMRNEFNAGLKVKAGFAAEDGWLQQLEVRYAKQAAVMKLRVVERKLELSEADIAAFDIPEKVQEAVKKSPPPNTGAGGPRVLTDPDRRLDRTKPPKPEKE